MLGDMYKVENSMNENNDTWISIKSIGAYGIGLFGTIATIVISGVCTWSISLIISMDKKLDIVAAQQLASVGQINAEIVRVIGDVDKAQTSIDDHRLRIAKLEFASSQQKVK